MLADIEETMDVQEIPGNRNSVAVAEEIMGVQKEEVPRSTEEIMDVQEVE